MRACWFWIGDINWHLSKVSYAISIACSKSYIVSKFMLFNAYLFLEALKRILQVSCLTSLNKNTNRQNNLTSLKQQHQRPPFYKWESQVRLGLGRDSSRRSSYPETHWAAEAEIKANSPSCPDCSRIILPQFLTQCLRNMSKTVRIGVGSRWVGESCERALRGQLSFYPGEAVSGCASGGDDWWCEFGWFLETSMWSRIWNASSNANIWILFLSCQDPEEDRAVGAKDASRWCLPILLPIVRKLSRKGENITGLVHCG